MIETIEKRQKAHIKNLSERMVKINELAFEIVEYTNNLPYGKVKLNPVRERIADIIALTVNKEQ